MSVVVRPVVRQYKPAFTREASVHVRAGGHAVIWDAPKKARLVVPVPNDKNPQDLAYWSMLDLGKTDFVVEPRGLLRGLAQMKVPRDCHAIVKRRAERDSVHPGPTKKLALDCLDCGACCRDNRVILDEDDVARFTKAGRPELARRPWAKREADGKVVLVLRRDKDCKHLGADNKCGVYPIRPEACSSFPMASECCLYAREAELGIVDGLRA